MSVRRLLQNAQPGPDREIEAHIRRGEYLESIIQMRFLDTRRAQQWHAKHVRWALEVSLSDRAPGTRYRYWLTVRVIGTVLNRWDGWQAYLQGPWTHARGRPVQGRHAGGRRPRLANRR